MNLRLNGLLGRCSDGSGLFSILSCAAADVLTSLVQQRKGACWTRVLPPTLHRLFMSFGYAHTPIETL